MHYGPPRRRRARPVADASLDALLDRSEDLAKGWLLALLEQAPLDDAPRLVATDLTREGPRVCEAVLRAIGSDADQRRLEPEGSLATLAGRVGELAGANGPRDTAQAIDALQGIVWAALRAELRDPDPQLVSELAERLAQVTAVLRAAALDSRPGAAFGPGNGYAEPPARYQAPAAVEWAAPARDQAPTAGEWAAPARDQPRPAERAPDPSPPTPPPTRASGARPSPTLRWGPSRPPRPVPPSASQQPQSPPVGQPPGVPPSPSVAEPQVRAWMAGDQPSDAPPPLWVSALGEEILGTGSAPLSLLLAELEDADRVLAIESEPDVTFSEFTHALRRAVRRQDMLVSETAARAWVIARDTDRTGARALAERISASVRDARPWRGAPMVASVGYAVLGEDGTTPAELIEAAEQARFMAAATGI